MPKWIACPTCFEMILDLKGHKCHDEIMKRVDLDVEQVVNEEISTLDDDIEVFWHSKDTKFRQFLLERERKGLSS